MSSTRNGFRWAAVAVAALLAVWPGAADARGRHGLVADVVLYEVWENVFMPDATHVERVAAISGSAKSDTMVCQTAAAVALTFGVMLDPGPTCFVTALGTNSIDLTNPFPFQAAGNFHVVVQLDNPFDSPELAVLAGTFSGQVMPRMELPSGTPRGIAKRLPQDFPVLLEILGGQMELFAPDGSPLGIVIPVAGTFRLPFGLDKHGYRVRARRGHPAFYLSDEGRLIKLDRDEFSAGYPTVRIEFTILGP